MKHNDPISDRVRDELISSGLTDRQASAAVEGSVTPKTIENFRNGRHAPNVRTVAALAELFGLRLVKTQVKEQAE